MDNSSVRWGLIAGIGIIILDLLLYLVDPQMVVGYTSYLEWIIYLFAMYKAGMDARAENGGFISWSQALKPTFLTFVVASLLYTIFMWLLYNVIDPGMADIQRQVAIESIEKMSGLMDEATVDSMMEAIEAQEFGLPLSGALLQFAFRLILPGFLFAAIISLIVRRNDPLAAAV